MNLYIAALKFLIMLGFYNNLFYSYRQHRILYSTTKTMINKPKTHFEFWTKTKTHFGLLIV